MICVDASVAAKWLFAEQHSDKAFALARKVALAGDTMVAPPLLPVEITNIIRQRMRRTGVPIEEARKLLKIFFGFPLSIGAPPDLHLQALTLAHRYGLPATYDAHYVALAEMLGGTLWTDDQRLLRDLSGRAPSVRAISEYGG